jgi:hypothetical protein
MSTTRVSPAVTTLIMMGVAILTLAIGFSFNPTTTAVVLAQAEPSPSPTPDEEKDRLQREADLATLKKTKAVADKDAAEARKAELEARFPKPTTSPLEGKTTVEGAVIESQMISYISLSRAADRIVDAIKDDVKGNNVAIYNERDIDLILSYRVATSQIKELVDHGYCEILTGAATNNLCPKSPPVVVHAPALTPVLPIAQSFLGAFIDMTALLRTNVEVKGQAFVIDEAPLVAEIFRSAKGRAPFSTVSKPTAIATPTATPTPKLSGDLFYPYVFPPNIDDERGSEILKRLEDVHKVRGNALQLIDAIQKDSDQIDKLTAKIKELENAIQDTLPKKSADAVTLAGTLIKANCPRLSADVDAINQGSGSAPSQSEAMISLIARVRKSCPRINPDKLALLFGSSNVLSETAKDLKDATDEQSKATDKLKKQQKKLTDDLAMLKLSTSPSPTADELKDAATAAIAQLKEINAQFENLVASLIQPQAGGVNPLTNYIRTERLFSALIPDATKTSYWLLLKVINAGGNNRIKTNLLVDIFTGGNRLSHSGGVIVEYHLFSLTGKSIQSGVVSDYTDYIKASKVHEITGSKN